MYKQALLTLALLAMVAYAPLSSSAVILQNQADQTSQILAFQPIGQSFVAEDAQVELAFSYQVLNADQPNDPLRLALFAGEGFGGSPLTTIDFMLPANQSGFFDVDLSAVSLNVGSVYTAVVTAPSGSERWAVEHTVTDVYAPGRLLSGNPLFYTLVCGSATNVTCADMRFRVTPINAVPEPAMALLVLAGLAGGLAARRRAI